MFSQIRIAASCLVLIGTTAAAQADWRKDFLTSQGIKLDKESLKEAADGNAVSEVAMELAYHKLNSTVFSEREEAQLLLQSKGAPVIKFLRAKLPIDHPETRKRVDEILTHLESNIGDSRLLMTQEAARSLLKNPEDKMTGGQYYEWFGGEQMDLNKGYRLWTYSGPDNSAPFVSGNQLTIPSKNLADTDQRVILRSSSWPQSKEFPKHFSVSCLIAGGNEGAGTYHPSIAIGKVKALFHPGYPGGAFRFEHIETKDKFSDNQNMGYTPKADSKHLMRVTVHCMENDKVELKVSITSSNKQRFEKQLIVTKKDTGPINEISLLRSGRRGGDAVFSDFHIEIHPD